MTTKAMTTKAQVKKTLKNLSIAQLCEIYEQSNVMDGDHVPTLRGWVMDELEKRDKKTFDRWLLSPDVSLMDKPSAFFNN